MLVKMVCPQCGASLEADDTREFLFCNYCGTQIMNAAQRYEVTQNVNVGGTVVHRYDNAGKPNLIVNFTSTHPAVGLKMRFVYNKQLSYLLNGQTMSFHMPYGQQSIVLKIGKINYNRTVYFPEDNAPVTIYASWNKRAHITIDQPPYQPPAPPMPQPIAAPAPAANRIFCPKCGKPMDPSLVFCSVCGEKNPLKP